MCIYVQHLIISTTQLHSIMNPDCSRLGLIKASLGNEERTGHGSVLAILSIDAKVRIDNDVFIFIPQRKSLYAVFD